MQQDGNDIPRLPAEDIVDRSTDIPDVAHDDERHRPDPERGNDDGEGDDLERDTRATD